MRSVARSAHGFSSGQSDFGDDIADGNGLPREDVDGMILQAVKSGSFSETSEDHVEKRTCSNGGTWMVPSMLRCMPKPSKTPNKVAHESDQTRQTEGRVEKDTSCARPTQEDARFLSCFCARCGSHRNVAGDDPSNVA